MTGSSPPVLERNHPGRPLVRIGAYLAGAPGAMQPSNASRSELLSVDSPSSGHRQSGSGREHSPLAIQTHVLPDGQSATIARQDTFRVQRIDSIWCVEGQRHAAVGLFEPNQLVAPSHLEPTKRGASFAEKTYAEILLQVDERWPQVTGVGQQIESVDLFMTQEGHVPSTEFEDADYRQLTESAISD